ncbi:MAG: ribulokinase [Saprospiraceae bacterium]|nr:ribulokinase [Saprospiraceae bacterium]
MLTKNRDEFVLGIDFGTDSVRAAVVNAATGAMVGSHVAHYPRWRDLLFCDPSQNQFRQHPLDYVESLEKATRGALQEAGMTAAGLVRGVAVDTTGSTPAAVDAAGTPLALHEGFAENPNAMFILWKDHTAIKEAQEINELCGRWSENYLKYEGGIYSSEWFWAKILRTIRVDKKVEHSAYSWVEHCDWIPYLLCGGSDIKTLKRSRCAAGHKAMWHEEFGGLPPDDFLETLDPKLKGLRDRLFTETYTADHAAGTLSAEWASRLGLSTEVTVAVGAFDAHMGAVGGQIEPYHLSKVMGTSTCDMLVAPLEDFGSKLIKGICGQVEGSVIPGMMGLEAGQSAFGDVYAWFGNVLKWPFEHVVQKSTLPEHLKEVLKQDLSDRLIDELSHHAATLPPSKSDPIAIDWLNGRRTPDANQSLQGAITGLNLGSQAPHIFRALVESTCFGARAIVDRFQEEGVKIEGIIGLGGVAKKSPYIMQTMANALNRPLKIARSEQTCALGAAMFAATAAGIYPRVEEAMHAMGAGFDAEYHPLEPDVNDLAAKYRAYQTTGHFLEGTT